MKERSKDIELCVWVCVSVCVKEKDSSTCTQQWIRIEMLEEVSACLQSHTCTLYVPILWHVCVCVCVCVPNNIITKVARIH